jgi:hypothetical protein
MVFTVTCKKCNKKAPTDQVRLQADKTYVCFACAGYKHEERANTPFRPTQDHPQQTVQKIRYQCQKCKYEFVLKEGHTKRCPYCNGERIEEKTSAAQKLIDLHVPLRDDY